MAGRFSVDAVFKAIDRVTAPVSKMQGNVNRFFRVTKSGLDKLNRSVNSTFGALASFGKRAFIGVGAFAAVAVLQIRSFTEEISALHDTTQRLKFPIDKFQEWSFVAKQNGIDQEKFTGGLDKFNRSLGEARMGSGALFSFLKKADRPLLRQVLAVKDNAQAFELYIDAMRRVKDPNIQAALSQAAFGRGATNFVNIANQSAEAIAGMRNEMRMNGTVTEEQAARVDELGDRIDSLFMSLKGLRNSVLMPLVPTLTQLIEKFRVWNATNRDMIGLKVEQGLKFIIDNFDTLLKIATSAIKIFSMFIAVLIILKTIVLAGNAAIIIFNATMLLSKGAVLAWSGATLAATAVSKGATAAWVAFNAVFAATPIGLVVLGIAALIGVVILIIKYWDELVAGIKVGAAFMFKWLQILFPPFRIMVFLLEKIADLGKTVFSGLANLISPFKDLWNSVKSLSGAEVALTTSPSEAAGGVDSAPFVPQVLSPQERMAHTIEESIQRSSAEILIKDDSGRAEVSNQTGFQGGGLTLVQSGGFN